LGGRSAQRLEDSHIVTLVERPSRFTSLIKGPNKETNRRGGSAHSADPQAANGARGYHHAEVKV
jgi:hypothetical protein